MKHRDPCSTTILSNQVASQLLPVELSQALVSRKYPATYRSRRSSITASDSEPEIVESAWRTVSRLMSSRAASVHSSGGANSAWWRAKPAGSEMATVTSCRSTRGTGLEGAKDSVFVDGLYRFLHT